MKEGDMNDGRLTFWIDGREALPVRAIPYVTGWQRFTPDALVNSLALGIKWDFARCTNLVAYHLPGNKPVPVKPREWDAIGARLNGFEAELHQQHTNDNIGYAAWQCGAAGKLPAGVFVWLDEFEREYQADRKRVLFCDERPGDEELIIAPMMDAKTRAIVMEGFDMHRAQSAHGAMQALPDDMGTFIKDGDEPTTGKGKGGRPKSIEDKVIAVRQMMTRFEKAASTQFIPHELKGSAVDLLEACQRFEKSNKIKPMLFSTSKETFKGWLRRAGYTFPTGRTSDSEKNYWTQLVVKAKV